jgi:hypothetical protein
VKSEDVEQVGAALSDEFLDWWFAPWSYLSEVRLPGLSDALVARRDAYRQWCAAAGAVPDLPCDFDAQWQIAALHHASQLSACALLFGGLFAARAHDAELLNSLPRDERAWCMSVSLVQPLMACTANLPDVADGIVDVEVRGLAELAWRLEQGFPGMWSRLRGLVAGTRADTVDRLLLRSRTAGTLESVAARRRAQRCWRICCARTGLPISSTQAM